MFCSSNHVVKLLAPVTVAFGSCDDPSLRVPVLKVCKCYSVTFLNQTPIFD